MTVALNIFAAMALMAALVGAIWALAPRHGQARVTFAQRIIRALYHVAAWLEDLAIASDRGYLSYRMERALNEIEPENEQWASLSGRPVAGEVTES